MAEDWFADVRKYVPDASETVVAAIVRYCGIALRTRDASLVSFGDPVEIGRVRDNFLKKKLGLTESDAILNNAIAAVGERMKGEHFRNRVTVYYLLAQHFGKLGLFGGGAAATSFTEPFVVDTPIVSGSVAPAAPAGIGTAAAAAATGLASAPRAAEGFTSRSTTPPASGSIFGKWWLWLLILLAVILLFLLLRSCSAPSVQIGTDTVSANGATATNLSETDENNVAAAETNNMAETVVAAAGARVVAGARDGDPMLTVYFDTAKYAVPAEFADKASDIKAYVTAHLSARLAVSGFNDPSGNAAFNDALSKHRAQAVRAALEAIGIAKSSILLEKPTDATITGTDNSAARRVEVTIK